MAKFQITETIHSERVNTVRLGTTGAGNTYDDKEVGKAVKLSAASAYVLCAAGDPIEAYVSSVSGGTVDGYSLGGVIGKGYKAVTLDGLQATPGTGAIAIGDYVVVGTVVAKGTALSGALKVTKATDQAAAKAAPFKARLVQADATAVGTAGIVELL